MLKYQAMLNSYSYLDFQVISTIALPLKNEKAFLKKKAYLTLKKGPFREQGIDWFFEFSFPRTKEKYCRFGRKGKMLFVQYPRTTFKWTIKSKIYGWGERKCLVEDFTFHFLPLLAIERGAFLLHASSVALKGGAFLFAAQSGMGKSTIADFFRGRKKIVLSDDATLVHFNNGKYIAAATVPYLRLRAAQKKNKIKIRIKTANPHQLKAIYCLKKTKKNFSVKKVKPAMALFELLKHTFRFNLKSESKLQNELFFLSELVQNISVYFVSYPHQKSSLSKLEKILIQQSLTN